MPNREYADNGIVYLEYSKHETQMLDENKTLTERLEQAEKEQAELIFQLVQKGVI